MGLGRRRMLVVVASVGLTAAAMGVVGGLVWMRVFEPGGAGAGGGVEGGGRGTAAVSAPEVEQAAPRRLITSNVPLAAMTPLQLDPSAVLASAKVPDPAMAAWVERWKKQWEQGKEILPGDVHALPALLKDSPLNAVEMLALAHAYRFMAQDRDISPRFYDAASVRVERELNRPGMTAEEALPVLLAIAQHLDDFKAAFWPLIEENGQKQYAESLLRIYGGFVKWAETTQDPVLIKASRHPAVGMAECLYILGRPQESLDLLTKMKTDEMTVGEKSGWAFAMGLALVGLDRYPESVEYFAITAADAGNKSAKAAKVYMTHKVTQPRPATRGAAARPAVRGAGRGASRPAVLEFDETHPAATRRGLME